MYCQKLHEESYAGHEFLDSGGTFTIKLPITKMQVYIYIYLVGLQCLTSLSTIFQLYRGGQF
jgi:hypothetical protein